MLKFTFTETGYFLEPLPDSLEQWLPPRLTLMLKAGQPISLERCRAAIMLQSSDRCWRELHRLIQWDDQQAIALSSCDNEFLEVSLRGTWLTSNPQSNEGVFLVTLTPPTEASLYNLWLQNAPRPPIKAQG
ncbi:MAG: alr0857 family protein [Cyanobacteria bacterium J06638_20]